MNITLDNRLKNDTYLLGQFQYDDNQTNANGDGSLLLLSKNALFPWFILVPNTRENEFHKLPLKQQTNIQQQINALAAFIEKNFSTHKINIASIGNIVSQLHIHVIGRNKEDACWPGVIWGTSLFKDYDNNELASIKVQISGLLTSGL